jgi:hypothetical protein
LSDATADCGLTKETPRENKTAVDAVKTPGTTKKPELYSGLSATFYTENRAKSDFDAAPQIYACQPHTVRLLRFCIVNADTIPEPLSLSCHQLWGQGHAQGCSMTLETPGPCFLRPARVLAPGFQRLWLPTGNPLLTG